VELIKAELVAVVLRAASAGAGPCSRGTDGSQTPRWREMDSNHRSLAKSRESRHIDILPDSWRQAIRLFEASTVRKRSLSLALQVVHTEKSLSSVAWLAVFQLWTMRSKRSGRSSSR
jgi:hypothetical protein